MSISPSASASSFSGVDKRGIGLVFLCFLEEAAAFDGLSSSFGVAALRLLSVDFGVPGLRVDGVAVPDPELEAEALSILANVCLVKRTKTR